MKKIIFTVTSDLSYDQRMARISDALSGNDFQVELVGRKKKDSAPLKNKNYHQVRLNCVFEKGKLFYIEYNLRLFFYLLFRKTDIICSIDLDTLVPCYLVSKIRSKPLVYDAHEYFTEVIEVMHRPLVKKMWLLVEEWIVPKLKYAYTVGENIRQIFEKKYGTKFELIRNITSLEAFESVSKDEKYFIYIGVVNEGRGLEEFIEAMQYIDSKFYICGKGDIFERIEAKVKKMGLENKVKLLGFIHPAELRILTQKAYVGVLLLENKGLNYYYSLANKFFDYMHAGIPQITINFPEYKVINDEFQVAEMVDLKVEDIVKAANKLLSDDTYYEMLSQNARRASMKYNWQKESEKLVNFYRSINV